MKRITLVFACLGFLILAVLFAMVLAVPNAASRCLNYSQDAKGCWCWAANLCGKPLDWAEPEPAPPDDEDTDTGDGKWLTVEEACGDNIDTCPPPATQFDDTDDE